MVLNLNNPTDASLPLEQEAERISDPVERLRFLRRHASAPVPQPLAAPAPEPVAPVFQTIAAAKPSWPKFALVALGVLILAAVLWSFRQASPEVPEVAIPAVPVPGPPPPHVWQVERSAKEEVYSNGLSIDLSFATNNRPRAEFPIYELAGASTAPVSAGTAPRGIVFHTTESDLAPFEEEANKQLKTLGTMLLRYIQREHSYHYLIDRFGRVFRVVEETDAANHAGFSVWGDEKGVLVNLNDSFIGVAFEGSTNQREQITAAQITAARMLTELLRDRYSITAENCITHAQVSVNPDNLKLSNHTDWARAFPFAALNLPDNYTRRIAAVEAFGFNHDDILTGLAGGKDWTGLRSSDQRLRETAASQGMTEERYRGTLQSRYREILTQVRRQQAARATVPAKGV